MPTTYKGPYVLMHGDVWYLSGGSMPGGHLLGGLDKRHVCGPSDTLAMAVDPQDGVVMKHGEERRIRDWLATFTARISASGMRGLIGPDPVLLLFSPTEENLAVVNRCIECTGYAARLLPNAKAPEPVPAPAMR